MGTYRDRVAAGQALADLVAAKGYDDPVVLALPRGGVPVAAEVARRIGAPLDLVMVRKIGVPAQPELAAAAIVDGENPEMVVNEGVARHAGLSRDDIERLANAQLDEIRRRRAIYLQGRTPVRLTGRTAIVVDDGIATGATMRAALKAVARQGAAKVVLAVPVAAADTLASLRGEVDEVVCPTVSEFLGAIGAFYADFSQVPDAEVVRLLDEADRAAPNARP
jgi:putative phosphoribosyl transferase